MIFKKLFIFLIIVLIILFISIIINSSEKISLIQLYKEHYSNSQLKYFVGKDVNLLIEKLNQEQVINFYTEYTGNKKISESIIAWATYYHIPINLCFALCYVESAGFNIVAFNNNYGKDGKLLSVDRGLFQLNSIYFKLTINQFFDIDINCKNGIRYFSECYNQTDSVPLALIAYNMGIVKASLGLVSKMRELYVDKILNYETMLNEAFNIYRWEKN